MSYAFEQLPLAIALRDDATFDNFFVGDNSLLVEQLRRQLSNGDRYIYLHGVDGSGCSHLLQAACHEAGKKGMTSVYFPMYELQHYPPEDLFEGLEKLSMVCLDDIHFVVGKVDWEEALFHLFNRLDSAGVKLLIAANRAVRELPFKLADLKSRLSWGTIYQISPLTDQQQVEALQFRAIRRGLDMNIDVAQFIYHRCQRKTETLISILDDLDTASLKEQRRLTIPFVKTVMSW